MLRRRGIPVSICTGRMYSGTRQIAQQLGIEGPVACVDGSHIVHVSTRRSLFTATLDRDAAEKLRQWLSQVGLPSFAFASDTIVHDPTGRRYLSLLRSWSERMVAVESVTSVEGWATLREISAVIAIGDKPAVDAVMAGMNDEQTAPSGSRLQMVTFPLRGPGVGDCWALLVRRADTNKGTAIAWLANYHGIPVERVVAVGDWVNDVPMFKVAGKSFVMSQAPAEVRDASSFVLSAHSQIGGGIREAAERSGLL